MMLHTWSTYVLTALQSRVVGRAVTLMSTIKQCNAYCERESHTAGTANICVSHSILLLHLQHAALVSVLTRYDIMR